MHSKPNVESRVYSFSHLPRVERTGTLTSIPVTSPTQEKPPAGTLYMYV